MICVMHEAETYGHMEVNGKPANTRQIAALARISEKEAARLIAELEDAGVFSRADDGSIYSRRMVRDWGYELKHKAWGKTGGNPDLIKTEPGTTHKNDRTKRLTPQKNPRLFRSVFEEAGGKCELCSVELTRDTPYAPNSYQLDHIVEIKHGGTNDRDNLRAVCRQCNMARNFKQRDDEPVNPYIDGAVNEASDGTDKFLDTEAEAEADSEKKIPPTPPASGGLACDDGFEAFWQRYPRRDSKGHARKAWVTATRKAPPGEILAGLERYPFSENPKYQPLPATWLNGERWLTEGDDGFDPVLRAVGLTPEDFEKTQSPAWSLLQ